MLTLGFSRRSFYHPTRNEHSAASASNALTSTRRLSSKLVQAC